MGWTQQVNYPLGSSLRKQRWMEVYRDKLEPKLVFCISAQIFHITEHTFKAKNQGEIEIWNHKINQWQNDKVAWYDDICPNCGNLMRVFYIPGTTWLGACSEDCYKEIFTLIEASRNNQEKRS